MNAIYVNHTANSYLSHNTIVRFFYVVFHFLHSSPTHEYLVVLLHKVVCVCVCDAGVGEACKSVYLCVEVRVALLLYSSGAKHHEFAETGSLTDLELAK